MLTLGNKIIAGSFKSGASWEVGDVGISALGIDEALNKRRYLNGQVISQAQFVEFTAMLKSRVSVYPNLATTEVNWQAAVTNSDLGQCGQFVIDDDAGTIRLPKVVNINGLQDLTLLGGIKEAGLPSFSYNYPANYTGNPNGALDSYGGAADNRNYWRGWRNNGIYTDSIYGNSTTVQQEAVQYPYFIQVAEGIESSVDVSREIELNNPFSLLDYKYSEYELSNASWLLSNGQWNSGAVYQSVYDLLLAIYNGTVTKAGVSVKLSTETYADTDFVLNTSDTTFRLPLKVALASGKAVAGNGMNLGLTSDGSNSFGMSWDNGIGVTIGQANITLPNNAGSSGISITSGYGIGITTDPLKSGIETSANGLYLYFYVGEVVQDANIIAAAGVLTDVANLKNLSNLSPLGQKVIDGQWVHSELIVFNNTALTTTHQRYSLASYLPDDEYDYEVFVQMGTANTAAANIVSDLGFILPSRSTNTTNQLYNNAILPVGSGRYIEGYTTSGTSSNSTCVVRGYRRIGTNS